MDPLIEIKHKSGNISYCRASQILRITPEKQVVAEKVTYTEVTNIGEIVKKVNLAS